MAVRLSGCDELVLGCDLGGASGGAISVALGVMSRCWGATRSMLLVWWVAYCFSLSSIFLGWKSFEGKNRTWIGFTGQEGYFQINAKIDFHFAQFYVLTKYMRGVKWFPKTCFSQNKHTLSWVKTFVTSQMSSKVECDQGVHEWLREKISLFIWQKKYKKPIFVIESSKD